VGFERLEVLLEHLNLGRIKDMLMDAKSCSQVTPLVMETFSSPKFESLPRIDELRH